MPFGRNVKKMKNSKINNEGTNNKNIFASSMSQCGNIKETNSVCEKKKDVICLSNKKKYKQSSEHVSETLQKTLSGNQFTKLIENVMKTRTGSSLYQTLMYRVFEIIVEQTSQSDESKKKFENGENQVKTLLNSEMEQIVGKARRIQTKIIDQAQGALQVDSNELSNETISNDNDQNLSNDHLKIDQNPITVSDSRKYFIHLDSSLITKITGRFQLCEPKKHPKTVAEEIYGVSFNQYLKDDYVFAVCGKNFCGVFRCLKQLNENDESWNLEISSDTTNIEESSINNKNRFSRKKQNKDSIEALLSFYDEKDSFYTCCWSYDTKHETCSDRTLLIVSGELGAIRILDCYLQEEVGTLIGHGGAINDLKVSPLNPELLLSASRDTQIRLWNIKTKVCIAIFGGDRGHRDQVSCVQFHPFKSLFVSVSLDHSIKLWTLRSFDLMSAIEFSRIFDHEKFGQQFSTVSQHYPNFTTRNVHHNYVDSVCWHGEYLITKSCENELVIWKPGKSDESFEEIMNRWHHSDHDFEQMETTISKRITLIDNNIWFIKASLSSRQMLLACGTAQGEVLIYDLKTSTPDNIRLVFRILASKNSKKSVIRQCTWSRNEDVLIAATEDGQMIRIDMIRLYNDLTLKNILNHASLILPDSERKSQKTYPFDNKNIFKTNNHKPDEEISIKPTFEGEN